MRLAQQDGDEPTEVLASTGTPGVNEAERQMEEGRAG